MDWVNQLEGLPDLPDETLPDLYCQLLELSWRNSLQLWVTLLIWLIWAILVDPFEKLPDLPDSEWVRIVWRQLSWLLVLDLWRSWMCLANQCGDLLDRPVLPLKLNLWHLLQLLVI